MRISDWSSDVCSSDLPLDYELLQRTLQPHQAALARGAVDAQLGDHAVVIGRHPVAGVTPATDEDVHPARRVELRDGARRRREYARAFGVDPAFARLTLAAHLVLPAGQPRSLGHRGLHGP